MYVRGVAKKKASPTEGIRIKRIRKNKILTSIAVNDGGFAIKSFKCPKQRTKLLCVEYFFLANKGNSGTFTTL